LVLLGDLGDGETLLELWLKIVTIMDRLINSGQGDNLVSSLPSLTSFYPFPSRLSRGLQFEQCKNSLTTHQQEEAVSENLKNMLLVMSNGGYLAPPDEKPDQEELWNETWKRVNRFLPQFFEELFPEEAGKPKKAVGLPVREKSEAPEEKEGKEGEDEMEVKEKEGS
jgi:brefeldin A-resistance guanine nucleotide exchange factor 1